jgi:hypothetical protein
MFCDQDDVWMPTKIEDSFHAITKLRKQNSSALYFTDMKVVNDSLKEVSPSFFKDQRLNPEWSKNANYPLVQSIAAGCTMIFTQELIKKLHPIKAPLFQHDQWMLMHASYYGIVGFSSNKTVSYRQHDSNVVGSHKINVVYFLKKIRSLHLVIKRWIYIRRYFGNQITFQSLFLAKLELNKQRAFLTNRNT